MSTVHQQKRKVIEGVSELLVSVEDVLRAKYAVNGVCQHCAQFSGNLKVVALLGHTIQHRDFCLVVSRLFTLQRLANVFLSY